MKKIIVSLSLMMLVFGVKAQKGVISLKGNWRYKLDSLNIGLKSGWQNQNFTENITLPGTLDKAGIGNPVMMDTTNINKNVLLMLTRKHRYIGVAWYQKEINLTADLLDAEVFLERVIWQTDCWIDGKYLGTRKSLSSPQQFNTGKLSAGKHTIVLRIDNSKQYDIGVSDFAHAYTEGTQIMWNGVIGAIKLVPIQNTTIQNLQVYPDLATQSVLCKLDVTHQGNTKLRLKIWDKNQVIATQTQDLVLKNNTQNIEQTIKLNNVSAWDEFNPKLYQITAEIVDNSERVLVSKNTNFGFRKLENAKGILHLNGKRIFLRGTLDCNIYPIEGHPPTDNAGWAKVFATAKSYGLNHIRYHSWCPPEAAFAVADSMGIYLQIENPLWILTIGNDKPTLDFIEEEAQKIIANYGNHPSFCFWSMGNELEGDFDYLTNLVYKLKKQDTRHFYATTTFTFKKGHGRSPEPADDYFVTQYTKKGWVRGQGVFNAEPPNFNTDYSKATDSLTVPLITHEIGQYSVYPDLKEINKYTGVLDPLNFKTVRHDLVKKKLISLADSFKLASGKFAVNLYKEEIERAIKTNNISGFQLLDLHDFPGQGTALVGLLNAFWESKGLVKPEEFRQFCSPVVPLMRFPKATYYNNETFKATAQIANFTNKKMDAKPEWSITDNNNKLVILKKLNSSTFMIGNNDVSEIEFPLAQIKEAKELTITLNIPNSEYKNSWKIWVYPAKIEEVTKNAIFTTSIEKAMDLLEKGENVVLNPDTSNIKGVNGIFTSVFWSPVHFPNQPGTMGILCNPKNPALANFPTEFYSNWQWWDLITHSKTMILDDLPNSISPIVRLVDNFFKNRKMATIIEAKVGKGKLILCSMNLETDIENRPAAKQLKYSLMKYASGRGFNPTVELSKEQVLSLTKTVPKDLVVENDANYLKDVVTELKKKWSANRTINLVFHGHSVPSGYLNTPIITTMDSYPNLALKYVTQQYPTAVVNAIKTCIGGENAVQGATRFEKDVLSHKPDVIFIDYALNDRRNGLEKSKIAWESMINQALKANIKVVLLTPTPDTKEDILNTDTPLAQHTRQIIELGKQYNIPVIDSYGIFKKMVQSGVVLNDYMAQPNHINALGHDVVAKLIKSLFK
jgi:Glycosyl hydrolases family 2/GDSL-like Lipase/Acylhydrolase family/Glycosyl hydrolases family 2, sugar binding domain/Glycosyl hydrolases family 2, TIM barrel domain